MLSARPPSLWEHLLATPLSSRPNKKILYVGLIIKCPPSINNYHNNTPEPVYLRFSGGRPWNTNSFCGCNKQNSCTMVRCSGMVNTTVGSCGVQCVQCGIFHPTCCNKSAILPQAVSCCCCRLELLLGRCSHTLISIDTPNLYITLLYSNDQNQIHFNRKL